MRTPRNVLGTELETCSMSPITGFFRDGCCRNGPGDVGLHLVCTRVTEEFLQFSAAQGNDLDLTRISYNFAVPVPAW